jgi:hypothetical protein
MDGLTQRLDEVEDVIHDGAEEPVLDTGVDCYQHALSSGRASSVPLT